MLRTGDFSRPPHRTVKALQGLPKLIPRETLLIPASADEGAGSRMRPGSGPAAAWICPQAGSGRSCQAPA